MIFPTRLKRAFTSLASDVEELRPRFRRSPEVQDLTHQIISVIYTIDFESISPSEISGLVSNIAIVRSNINRSLHAGSETPIGEVTVFLHRLHDWVMALPGDPTTPPPEFEAAFA